MIKNSDICVVFKKRHDLKLAEVQSKVGIAVGRESSTVGDNNSESFRNVDS